MIRIELPAHLRALAGEVSVEIDGEVTVPYRGIEVAWFPSLGREHTQMLLSGRRQGSHGKSLASGSIKIILHQLDPVCVFG